MFVQHLFSAVFLFPQTVQDGRQFMKFIDSKLGVPLPERDYGGNCLIFDPGNKTDPYHNIWVRLICISKLLYFFTNSRNNPTTLK